MTPQLSVSTDKPELSVDRSYQGYLAGWDSGNWDSGTWDQAFDGPQPTPTLTVSTGPTPNISL